MLMTVGQEKPSLRFCLVAGKFLQVNCRRLFASEKILVLYRYEFGNRNLKKACSCCVETNIVVYN